MKLQVRIATNQPTAASTQSSHPLPLPEYVSNHTCPDLSNMGEEGLGAVPRRTAMGGLVRSSGVKGKKRGCFRGDGGASGDGFELTGRGARTSHRLPTSSCSFCGSSTVKDTAPGGRAGRVTAPTTARWAIATRWPLILM